MSHAPHRSEQDAAPAQDGPSVAAAGARRARSQLPAGQRFARFAGDWLGISVLFCLWIGMLLLVTHIVVVPRTCAQRWPAWVPIIGDIKSMLPSGRPPRPECLGAQVAEARGAVPSTSSLNDGMTSYVLSDEALGLSLALLAVAAIPLLLSFGAALIAKWQQAPRARHRFLPETDRPDSDWGERERRWKREATERIQRLWVIEARHSVQAQHRMMQHACLYGFATSAVFAWGLIVNNGGTLACQTRMMAIAAGSAAFTSFSLSFGRLTVRASIRDTSARMFAYALRALILSVLSAVLLVALLWHHSVSGGTAAADAAQLAKDSAVLAQQPFKGPTSYMMLGMVVALIGEGVLSQITSRAAAAVSLQMPARASAGAGQLSSIDGLSELDVVRLGEEGIDSIHALAMASTAALYFSTPYTLQRLCDWQDQALLITYVGLAKAQTCREKLMVRGAIDLQRKAEFLMVEAAGSAAERETKQKTFEIIRSSLGFISIEQARESLFPLANDEVIRRLRIYHRGSVIET